MVGTITTRYIPRVIIDEAPRDFDTLWICRSSCMYDVWSNSFMYAQYMSNYLVVSLVNIFRQYVFSIMTKGTSVIGIAFIVVDVNYSSLCSLLGENQQPVFQYSLYVSGNYCSIIMRQKCVPIVVSECKLLWTLKLLVKPYLKSLSML